MKETVTEIVVYRIKKEVLGSYPALSANVQDFLKTRAGFISRKVLFDTNDPGLFSDIVEWENVGLAKETEASAMQEPSLQEFFAATENIVHFNFYRNYH